MRALVGDPGPLVAWAILFIVEASQQISDVVYMKVKQYAEIMNQSFQRVESALVENKGVLKELVLRDMVMEVYEIMKLLED